MSQSERHDLKDRVNRSRAAVATTSLVAISVALAFGLASCGSTPTQNEITTESSTSQTPEASNRLQQVLIDTSWSVTHFEGPIDIVDTVNWTIRANDGTVADTEKAAIQGPPGIAFYTHVSDRPIATIRRVCEHQFTALQWSDMGYEPLAEKVSPNVDVGSIGCPFDLPMDVFVTPGQPVLAELDDGKLILQTTSSDGSSWLMELEQDETLLRCTPRFCR